MTNYFHGDKKKAHICAGIILTAISLIFVLPHASLGQNTETLLSDDTEPYTNRIEHSGFGGPVVGIASINNGTYYMLGFQGTWVINLNILQSVHLGITGYRTLNNFNADIKTAPNIETPTMDMKYGGFIGEYVRRPYKLFHYGFQLMAGVGQTKLKNFESLQVDKTSDNFFTFKPGVSAIMNVTNWFRVSGSFNYRFASGVDLRGTSSSDMSGISSYITLQFGWF